MTTNKYLEAGIDLATQAKFSYLYEGGPGYADGDVLYEVLEYFGIIITQSTPSVAVTLPTTGFSTGTRHYFRQITSRYGSAFPITIDLDGSNTVVLDPGSTCYVFWTGSQWMAFPGPEYTTEQGRIESVSNKSYMVVRGLRPIKYINSVYFNVDIGSGDVNLTIDGLVVTTASINLVSGTESQYTFSPKLEVNESTTVGLTFSNTSTLEGVHYRFDLDSMT